MLKRRMCSGKPVRAGEAKVRSVGWGSSLLDEARDLPLPPVSAQTPPWPCVGDVGLQENHQHNQQQRHESIAQLMARNERRHHPRLVHPAEISIRQLSFGTESDVVSAELHDLSRGGICIGSHVPLVTSSVVQCQIGVPELVFGIPTLMQVMWLERTGPSAYSAGLRYLL